MSRFLHHQIRQAGQRFGRCRFPTDSHRSPEPQQPAQGQQQGGFSRPVSPNHRDDGPFGDLQVRDMQHFPAAPETAEAMQFQTGFHPFCRPCLGTEGEQLPSIHGPQAKGLACLRIQCRHLFRRKIPTELPVLQQQIAIRQTVQVPEAMFGHQDRHTGGFHGLQQAP